MPWARRKCGIVTVTALHFWSRALRASLVIFDDNSCWMWLVSRAWAWMPVLRSPFLMCSMRSVGAGVRPCTQGSGSDLWLSTGEVVRIRGSIVVSSGL